MAEIATLWSARQNRGPGVEPMITADAAKVFTSLLDELFRRDDFQEAFGYHCVDENEVPGTLGADPSGRLLVETGRNNLFPAHDHYESWDEDSLLDAVELYDQLVSRG